MLRLFLLRHGKAANPENYDHDYDRPLNKKGVLQCNQIGYKLHYEGVKIDQIISSSARRTEETTLCVDHYLGVNEIEYFEDLYLADRVHIMSQIQKLAKNENVLYVGHNFGISDFASYLSGETIGMSTGMLVELEFAIDSWEMLTGGLGTIVTSHAPNVYIP